MRLEASEVKVAKSDSSSKCQAMVRSDGQTAVSLIFSCLLSISSLDLEPKHVPPKSRPPQMCHKTASRTSLYTMIQSAYLSLSHCARQHLRRCMLPAPSVSSCHLRPRRYISSASTDAYPHDMTPATRRLAEAILSSENDAPNIHDGRTFRRLALSKAITLIESRAEVHMRQADLLLNFLLRHSAIGDDNEKPTSTNSDNTAKDGLSSFLENG